MSSLTRSSLTILSLVFIGCAVAVWINVHHKDMLYKQQLATENQSCVADYIAHPPANNNDPITLELENDQIMLNDPYLPGFYTALQDIPKLQQEEQQEVQSGATTYCTSLTSQQLDQTYGTGNQ